MRQLSLHASALNDAEYELYTTSLDDLADARGDPHRSADDAYYEALKVGVREARAWLRGRYSHIPVSDIDSILRFFHPNLGHADTLSGGQFFAAFRLVLHAEGGEVIDRGLAFIQAHPSSKPKPPSPAKPPPPPIAPRPLSLNPRPPAVDRNPFSRVSIDVQPTTLPPDDAPAPPPVPQTQPQPHRRSSSKVTHNPFLLRDKSPSKLAPDTAHARTPPLPPRKPAPALPLVPPPRHSSLLVAPLLPTPACAPAPPPKSHPPVIPAASLHYLAASAPAPAHVTSPLMRQSLQASKTAQAMKKAEEQLERERFMSVLKKASAPRSVSPAKTRPPPSVPSVAVLERASSASGSSTGGREAGEAREWREEAPPLPARKKSLASMSVGSSASSSRMSLDQVAGASLTKHRPFSSVSTNTSASPFDSAQEDASMDVGTTSAPPPPLLLPPAPPTHPDRKPPSIDVIANSGYSPLTPTSPTQRIFRSKSLHHPSPPPVPPPRRKRPESVSVQLTPTTPPETPYYTPNAVHQHFAQQQQQSQQSQSQGHSRASSVTSPTFPHLSRRVSYTSASSTKSAGTAPGDAPSPIAHLQRTLTSLQLKAQPRFDAARYKAEAGLSRRGYVHHAQRSPWVEEGEEGLMPGQRARRQLGMDWRTDDEDGDGDGAGVDVDSLVGDTDASEEERERGRRGNDSLKWPAGEGWRPL